MQYRCTLYRLSFLSRYRRCNRERPRGSLFENAGISRRRLEADVTPPHVNRPPSSDQYASSLGTLYYLFVFTLRELRNGGKGFLEKLNVSLRTVFLEDQFLETFREWDGMGFIFAKSIYIVRFEWLCSRMLGFCNSLSICKYENFFSCILFLNVNPWSLIYCMDKLWCRFFFFFN